MSSASEGVTNGTILRNLQVGDVVIVREDNTPPTQWPLARIIKMHAGKDGYVTVVKLKMRYVH